MPEPRRSWVWLYIMVGVLAGLLVVGAGLYSLYGRVKESIAAVQSEGDQVAQGVLGRLKGGTEAAIWDEAAPAFREAISRERLTDLFTLVTTQVGRPVSWEVTGVRKETLLTSNGPLVATTFTYRVVHERGTTAAILRVDEQRRLLSVHFQLGQ